MADIGVFPTLLGLGWSLTKTPIYQTRVQRAVSGRELKALDYPYPLYSFELTYNFLRNYPQAGFAEFTTLFGFFLQCQGAFQTFLFDDITDDSVTGQFIGTGNGSLATFQLQRALGGFVEPIFAPNVVANIYFNGTPIAASQYSVNSATGIVSLTNIPAAGVIVTADFTYYYRCRFVDDSYPFEQIMSNLWQVKKLTFISVRP